METQGHLVALSGSSLGLVDRIQWLDLSANTTGKFSASKKRWGRIRRRFHRAPGNAFIVSGRVDAHRSAVSGRRRPHSQRNYLLGRYPPSSLEQEPTQQSKEFLNDVFTRLHSDQRLSAG